MCLKQLYDLDGKEYDENDVVKLYMDVLADFKKKNKSFIGAKLIFTAPKHLVDRLEKFFRVGAKIHKDHSDFVVGIDLVGPEDSPKCPSLHSLKNDFLKCPPDMKFFFHAGEINWFEYEAENLVIIIFTFYFSLNLFFFFFCVNFCFSSCLYL